MSFDPVKHRRKSIQHLKPYYKAPEGAMLRLDQNTNLTGPNPVVSRVQVDGLELSLYPSRDADRLIRAIERHHGLPPDSVTCANGSDEALDLILKAYTEPGDRLATLDPSYSLYPFYAAVHGLEHIAVANRDDWRPDLDALRASDAKVLLIANPNNPTGTTADKTELERLVKEHPGLVVVDEAYADYHDPQGLLPLVAEHRNLVIMRTFSKAHALAGIRLGWLAAHPETTEALRLVKPPFNVGVVTEQLGLLALEEGRFLRDSVDTVMRERARLQKTLKGLGFRVVPSQANFLLTFPPPDAPDGPTLLERLREKGIATRAFPQHPRLSRAIRFTIGEADQMDRLTETLEMALQEPGGATT